MRTLLVLLVLFTGCGPTVNTAGPQGIPGPAGSPGVSGVAGVPGTQITLVQLCGSCTPAYPSTFAEVALCISNQLYGVYSIPDAFLTLITPGVYSSTGVNCTCTLTVAPNCVVMGG